MPVNMDVDQYYRQSSGNQNEDDWWPAIEMANVQVRSVSPSQTVH